MRKLALCLVFLLAGAPAWAQISREREKELFSRVDEMLARVSQIMGMKVNRPVPRAVISRDEIRKYIDRRMAETLSPEEIRSQEIVLKKFGFIPQNYDLKGQMLDLLTEQAAAFYDFKQKKLYLASWTPSSMHEMAIVHELAHAVADQHYNLEKFIKRSGDDDDASVARGAVVEGQASWVMTEYMAQQMGQSLRTSPALLDSAVQSSADAAKTFPVLGGAPLYIQETLMFPYNQGMLFQHALFRKLGQAAFAEVFRRPPVSSQQIIHPDRYFSRVTPTRPALPAVSLPSGYKKTVEGTVGQLDHQILLEQYIGRDEARSLAPKWKGGRYALWENTKADRSVLAYAVEWENEDAAAKFYEFYRKICATKWKQAGVEGDPGVEATGTGGDGRFRWVLRGTTFTSVEGLP